MSTSEPVPVPFASLRLSPKAFAKYAKDHRVDDEATEAITKSNAKKKEYLEVKWGSKDPMEHIMKRLEQQLKIPYEHWSLAGDGMVFTALDMVENIGIFQNHTEQLELTLLPNSEAEQYLEDFGKNSSWRRLAPQRSTSADPRGLAKARFNLIEPIESDKWVSYLTNRLEVAKGMDERCEDYQHDETDCLVPQIKRAVKVVLEAALEDKQQREAIADGVMILSHDVTDDGGGDIQECNMMSRIYSPTTPASVDISFTYWHKPRYYSVEWFYMICYRINQKPPPKGARPGPIPKNLRKIPKAWKLISGAGLEDMEPDRRWKAIECKEFGLSPSDVNRLHRTLFGTPAEGNVASKFHKVHMIRLMLASVGITYGIDVEETKGMNMTDGKQHANYKFDLCNKAEWLAMSVRRACGASLERDGKFKDYDPRDRYSDDDEEEEEDDDDDEYDEEEEEAGVRRDLSHLTADDINFVFGPSRPLKLHERYSGEDESDEDDDDEDDDEDEEVSVRRDLSGLTIGEINFVVVSSRPLNDRDRRRYR